MGSKVRCSHILAKHSICLLAINRVKAGESFAKVAQELSECPSRKKGGDLGFFSRGQMVKPFSDAAFRLKVDELTSEPVKTGFGWHVILLEERRQQEPPSFEESRDEIRNELAGQMVSEVVTGLREGAVIEEFNIDGSPLESSE